MENAEKKVQAKVNDKKQKGIKVVSRMDLRGILTEPIMALLHKIMLH